MAHPLYAFGSCVARHIFELLLPTICAGCERYNNESNILCAVCADAIHPIVSVDVPITGTHTMSVLAVAAYTGTIKKLILRKKAGDIIAAHQLGQLVWQMTYVKNIPFDCIVPIPLHWMRFARRGFNQAEEMSVVLSAASKKPMIPLLRRHKHTAYQATLQAHERTENLANAFTLNTTYIEQCRGKHLLLVDDLMTTGATFKTAARALLNLKPASITAVVAGRVV